MSFRFSGELLKKFEKCLALMAEGSRMGKDLLSKSRLARLALNRGIDSLLAELEKENDQVKNAA